MMLCLYYSYMLLSISALCYALPIEQDTHDNFNNTSSDSDVFLSNLLPPLLHQRLPHLQLLQPGHLCPRHVFGNFFLWHNVTF